MKNVYISRPRIIKIQIRLDGKKICNIDNIITYSIENNLDKLKELAEHIKANYGKDYSLLIHNERCNILGEHYPYIRKKRSGRPKILNIEDRKDIININDMSNTDIAAMYGVSRQLISHIKLNRV